GVAKVSNITSHPTKGIGGWTDSEIKQALVKGVGRDGRTFNPPMARHIYFSKMTEDDLNSLAVWRRTLPPLDQVRLSAATMQSGITPGHFLQRCGMVPFLELSSTRRDLITLLGGAAAAWPVAARAQQPERMRRIGVLTGFVEDDPENKARLAALRQGLEKRGWSEGRNVHIEYRYAPAGAQAQVLAKELVALQPDVILANSTLITAALQRESRTVPIVFAIVADPIGSGFVASLPRPGGNITGVMLEASVTGKWLAMLKEIAPRLERAALVMNPKTAPFYNYYLRAAESLSPSLGIKHVPSLVENVTDIERTIEAFARTLNGGLLLPG